jgi:hypothetical protein
VRMQAVRTDGADARDGGIERARRRTSCVRGRVASVRTGSSVRADGHCSCGRFRVFARTCSINVDTLVRPRGRVLTSAWTQPIYSCGNF